MERVFEVLAMPEDKPDRPKSQNDWLQGYGYQFWRCQHGHFRGDGAFGQFTIVLPEHDAVIVMTSENKNMQGQLDLVWQHLLPALQAATPQTDASLVKKLGTLKLAPPKGSSTSPAIQNIKGKTFALESNDLGLSEAAFAFEDGACIFTAKAAAASHVITCGLEDWKRGTAAFPGTPPRLISGGKPKEQAVSKIAAHATWEDENTLVMTWRYYETPHRDTITCKFEGEQLTLGFLSSVAAMSGKTTDSRPVLKGRMIV